MKAILSSIGVAGILVGCGYIAQSARDAFLGMNFPVSMTVDAYARVGGRFLTVTMSDMWQHPWISGIAMGMLVTIFLIGSVFRSPWRPEHNGIAQGAALFIIFLAYVWKAYRLDLPYIRMVGVLTRPPIEEIVDKKDGPTPASAGVAAKTIAQVFSAHNVWGRLLCEHIVESDGKLPDPLPTEFSQCRNRPSCNSASFRALKELVAPGNGDVCLSTEQEYIADVWASLVLMTLTILLVRSWYLRAGSVRAMSFRTNCRLGFRVLMIGVAVLGSLTLPYVFGKVVDSTSFPAGRVVYDSTDLSLKPKLDEAKGLIIASDEKFVIVYLTDPAVEYQSLPRSRVRYVAVNSVRDIIKTYSASFIREK